jgi:hypothetical protein
VCGRAAIIVGVGGHQSQGAQALLVATVARCRCRLAWRSTKVTSARLKLAHAAQTVLALAGAVNLTLTIQARLGPATHNVFAGRRCQAPGRRAGQGPHWRVPSKQLPPCMTRNGCTWLTRCSSSTTTRMPPPPLHAPDCLRAPTDKTRRHLSRVIRYARPSDWLTGAAVGAISPGLMLYWERVSPSFVGKGGFAPVMRLSGAVGVAGAVIFAYSRSACTCMTSAIGPTLIDPNTVLTQDSPLLRRAREPP